MEHGHIFLGQAAIYFAAAVFAVMAAHRLGLGSVAGYLLAGIAIGPWGFKLIGQPEAISAFAELGVVFLLFLIGLELEPQRLWHMRTRLLGLGLSQVLGSIAVIAAAALAGGFDMRVALIAGMALSLSSTALALQPLTERGALATQGGQAGFAILLLQDLAVIPMLAVLPLLGTSGGWSGFTWQGLVFALKGAVLFLISHFARLPLAERPLFILLLAQGGEFAFVILGLGAANGALPEATAQAITLAVALSMIATPFFLLAHDRLIAPRFALAPAREPDLPQPSKVIVAGLGRVGQVVARLLNASGYQPTVLDDNPDHVEQSRQFGFRVFYGDATRLDLLHAAGAASANLLVIALDDRDAVTQLARIARTHFPRPQPIARAYDMRHMFELRDLGVEMLERETWLAAIKLGETALSVVTQDPARASRAAQAFAEHDHVVQAKLYAVHKDEPDAHVTVSNELRDQLARSLAEDEAAVKSRA